MFGIERITLCSTNLKIHNSLSGFFRPSPTIDIIRIFILKYTAQIISILRSTVPQWSSGNPPDKSNQPQTSTFIYTTKVLGSFHIFIRHHAISSLCIRHNLFYHRMNRFFLKVHIISRMNHIINIRSFSIHTHQQHVKIATHKIHLSDAVAQVTILLRIVGSIVFLHIFYNQVRLTDAFIKSLPILPYATG